MKRTFTVLLFLILCSIYASSQCNNFNNSISPSFYPMGNTCNGIPSNTVNICATINVTFSSGNASFQYGYIINGVKTPVSAILNTSGNTPLNVQVCISNAPCSASIQFYITAWSNPNGGGSICTQTNASITSVPVFPLPVELISFSSENTKMGNLITWATLTEINNKHFILEQSLDGREWNVLSHIQGQGNSNKLVQYSYLDNTTRFLNYYRITQVDFDGSQTISNVIKQYRIQITSNSTVTIFPNPTHGLLNINHLSDQEIAIQKITNSIGKEVPNIDFLSSSLDITSLDPGIYFIHFTENGTPFNKRFIKI